MKRFLLRLVAVVVAGGLALALGEALVRLLLPAYDPSGRIGFRRLPDGTAVGLPGAIGRQIKNTDDYNVEVKFNDIGLRDAKSLQSSRDDSLFVVGDSFAFGWGVEERQRFSDLLEERLGRPVFNVSAASADLDGYGRLIHYAEVHGARIGTLIVSVCMENDLRLYGDRSGGPPADERHRDVKAFLTDHSAAYLLLTTLLHRRAGLEGIAGRLGLVVPNLEGIAESDYSDGAVRSSADRIKSLVGERRAVILIVPSRALWVGAADRRQAVARAHDAFVGRLRHSGLAVVDVRDRFERDGRPLTFHFANDGHWNAAGHRVAAEALAAELTSPYSRTGR